MKYKKIASAILATLGALVVSNVQTANVSALETWGPQDRATFTWETPATYVTFNSITNNPSLGHESNFVRIREYNSGQKFTDEVTLEVGKEYEVFIYYHNNGAANYGAEVMAQNARIRTAFPEKLTAGQAGMIKGYITATNANPTEVWDSTFVKANDTVYLRYVSNSAVLHNGSQGEYSTNGMEVSGDALLSSTGVKIAYDNRYWGYIPGCNEYAGYITYRIKADQPGWKTSKTVSVEGKNQYGTSIVAAPGDTLDFKLKYENVGTTWQNAVGLYDAMPNGLNYIAGSTFAVSPDAPNGATVADKLFTNSGLNIGNYNSGQSATVTYKAKLSTDKTIFSCGDTTIYNAAQSKTANGDQYAQVKITVRRECCADGSDPDENGQCPVKKCWDGSEPNSEGKCPVKCPDGSKADEDGKCPVKKCWDGSDPDGEGKCPVKCPDGSRADEDGKCPVKKCEEGTALNDKGECVKKCDDGSMPDKNGKCPVKCNDGSEPDENGKCIVKECAEGTVMNDKGECVRKCNDGSEPDENGKCIVKECAEGMVLTGDGKCVRKCDDGSMPDEDGKCPAKCDDGSTPDENGECPVKKCDDGSEPDAEGNCPVKKCADGSEPDENGNCPKTCAEGQTLDANGNCVALPTEMPKTGPTEIVLASMVVILLAAGGAYWFISWDQLRSTKSAVSGAKKVNLEHPTNDSVSKDEDIVRDSIINNK